MALDHDLAEAHLAIASSAGTIYGHFNWARLLTEVDEALKLDPSLDLAYASRARGLYHLGLFDAARAAASKAIALNPARTSKPSGWWSRIVFSGRFEDARQRRGTGHRTDAPVIRMYLGEACFIWGAAIRRGPAR